MENTDLFSILCPEDSQMTDYIQVTTVTSSQKEAEKYRPSIAGARLAGCVQIYGPVSSTYWWQGAIESVTGMGLPILRPTASSIPR